MEPGRLTRLAGSYATPCPRLPLTGWPALAGMSRTRLTALAAPGDALILDNIAALVQERYAEVVWIRLGAADADPGALLVTLLGALARLDAAAAAGIREAAARRARQGDWGQAYRLLGATLGAVTSPPAVVVLEGAEHLGAGRPAPLDLLRSVLLPGLRPARPEDPDVLLISGLEWGPQRLAPPGQMLGPRQLQLDRGAAALTAQSLGVNLPPAALSRIFAVTRGGAGALHAALRSRAVIGCGAFDAVAGAAASPAELLAGLARSMLARASADTRIALAGAIRLGVWHPSMGTALGHSTVPWDEPWWLDLPGGWKQLVPAWRAPLQSAGTAAALDSASLTLLGDHLAGHGITDRAFDLYLEAGELGRAADAAASLAGDLALLGCWQAMARLGQQLTGRMPAIQAGAAERVAGQPSRRWWHRRAGRRPADQASRLPDPSRTAVQGPASAAEQAPGSRSRVGAGRRSRVGAGLRSRGRRAASACSGNRGAARPDRPPARRVAGGAG